MKQCTTGKECHPNRAEATVHLKRLKAGFKKSGKMARVKEQPNVYKCYFCGCWHVGRYFKRREKFKKSK